MSSLQRTVNKPQSAQSNFAVATDAGAVLVREAGVPYQPPFGQEDPIAEWISLMEVVQMLCLVWPVREKPMVGKHWKL